MFDGLGKNQILNRRGSAEVSGYCLWTRGEASRPIKLLGIQLGDCLGYSGDVVEIREVSVAR